MKKPGGFSLPMSKAEVIVGWVWVFVHVFALGYLVNAASVLCARFFGSPLTDVQKEIMYFAVSTAFIVLTMWNYLRISIGDLARNTFDALSAVAIGYAVMILLVWLIRLVVGLVFPGASLPSGVRLNPGAFWVVGIILAPIAEEVLFRGVVFGFIREQNAVAAYIISAFLFSLYHMWEGILAGFNPAMLWALVLWVPASIVLGWSYARGRTVLAPIVLHVLLNALLVTVEWAY